jgi:hypothetical protein
VAPNQTWAQPPFYASQMVYRSYQPHALPVTLPNTTTASNLTVFAASSTSSPSTQGEVVVRLLNNNDVAANVSFVTKFLNSTHLTFFCQRFAFE